MHYGIIAAGEGSRLVEEGIKTPKPLVLLNGEHLMDRMIRIFISNKAESVSIIVNEDMKEVHRHLLQLSLPVPLNIIVKSTPSSLHSFYELTRYLDAEKFCVTTVDTIFKESDFTGYIRHFETLGNAGLMGVTSFIDDEKPLYVKTEQLAIMAFEDHVSPNVRYISGGIYGLTPQVFPTLNRCIEQGIFRMRNFQREIIADRIPLFAYPFSKIIDVDHAEDIRKAEAFLQNK